MLSLKFLIPLAALVTAVLSKKCHHNDCFRAIACYEKDTSTAFCSNYLATPYTVLSNSLQNLTNSQQYADRSPGSGRMWPHRASWPSH